MKHGHRSLCKGCIVASRNLLVQGPCPCGLPVTLNVAQMFTVAWCRYVVKNRIETRYGMDCSQSRGMQMLNMI